MSPSLVQRRVTPCVSCCDNFPISPSIGTKRSGCKKRAVAIAGFSGAFILVVQRDPVLEPLHVKRDTDVKRSFGLRGADHHVGITIAVLLFARDAVGNGLSIFRSVIDWYVSSYGNGIHNRSSLLPAGIAGTCTTEVNSKLRDGGSAVVRRVDGS